METTVTEIRSQLKEQFLNTEAITKEVILTIEQLLQVKNRHPVIKGKAIV